jgi:chemotaxis protein methyltransferase CheR
MENSIFPALLTKTKASIKIWSAACSTGQEPYSISICALNAMQKTDKHKTVQIIGTDISENVLDEAKAAAYSESSLSRGMDAINKARYFEKNYLGYSLKQEVTQQVRFQQFNLLKPFTALGNFDVIFCRNVLIYFSAEVKCDILLRMVECLEPDGYLFLSSSEALPPGINQLEAIQTQQTCIYRKVT